MCTARLSATDNELLQSYFSGDERALAYLVKRYKTKVFTQIMMFVRDTMTAEDLFQDTFIKAIETIRSGRYNEEGKFSQWICRIAYNLCVDHFRRNKRAPAIQQTEDFDIFDVIGHSEGSAEERMIRSQTCDKVRYMINQLPGEQKEVIMLRHYADLSFREIAELTNVSINTSLGRMRYALINMRRMMKEKPVAI